MMIGRLVLGLSLVCVAAEASAQQPSCTFYKVNTVALNVSQEAAGDRFIDAIEDGTVVCVTRQEKVKDRDWGFIAFRLEPPKGRVPVDGWGTLRFMQPLSPAEAAAITEGAPAPARVPGTVPPPSPPPSAAPPKAVAAPPVAPPKPAAVVRAEEILRFEQPIPFGPFPVNGRSIKDLADSIALFPPIEGLDDAQWKKNCSSCHKWDKAQLCQQGGTYVASARQILRHPHPFGGAYKLALMRWAKSGCE